MFPIVGPLSVVSHALCRACVYLGAQADELSDDIAEVHASSAGLKGLASYLAAIGIEDCRKCCGGHGYLLNSGVASLSADYVWQVRV